jgi:hypothetical protein
MALKRLRHTDDRRDSDPTGDEQILGSSILELEVALGFGDLDTGTGVVVRGRGDATKGRRARVGIRPARLSIVPGQATGTVNTARAVVASKMYLGDEVQVLATLEGGTPMLIREQRAGTDDSHDAIRPGDPITIQWERTAPVLLAESPDQPTHRGDHE